MNISPQQLTRALYQVAKDENQLQNIVVELDVAQKYQADLSNFLKNPQISVENKISNLKKNGFSKIIANFLLILIQSKKINKLGFIVSEIKNLINFESDSVDVEIITKSSLEISELESIKKNLSNRLNKNIILESSTDPRILGGIKIKIGDALLDGSLKSKLNKLKMELIK